MGGKAEADLDDDGVCGQIDPPGQSGCAHQDFEVTFGEHALHQAAVGAQHPGVMDPKTFWKHLPHLLVPGALDLSKQKTYDFSQKKNKSVHRVCKIT